MASTPLTTTRPYAPNPPHIQKLTKAVETRIYMDRHLPSPSLSRSIAEMQQKSKKRRHSDDLISIEEAGESKRRQTAQEPTQPSSLPSSAVAHWVETCEWPKLRDQDYLEMSLPGSSKRRSSSSQHHSDRQQRLEDNGVFMESSAQLQQDSKALCEDLLKGARKPEQHPYFPIEKADDVLKRVQRLNEARLQRDVTPWVVPSPENLYLSGESALGYLGEEVQAEWIRIAPLGQTKPKPDFAVGLQRCAFEHDELRKLENYTTLETPTFFTPNLCFPFLICEVKTEEVGLRKADVQNIHSASLAVRAIVKLFTVAYGKDHPKTTDLFGRILAFTVSHDSRMVNLYGHYAVADSAEGKEDGLKYFRYDIDIFSLRLHDGRHRYDSYNFVRNLYDHFAPDHLKRIKDAIGQLDMPAQTTGLSFPASELTVDDDDDDDGLQDPQAQQQGAFKTPSEPASVATKKRLDEQLRLNMQLKQQVSLGMHLKQQIEQLNEHSRQRQQHKQQMDQLSEQIRQQQQQHKQQMEQQQQQGQRQEQRQQMLEEQLNKELRQRQQMEERWKQIEEQQKQMDEQQKQMDEQRKQMEQMLNSFSS